MRKNTKNTSGMALGIAIVFITVMSVIVLALLVASMSAVRSARILPQMDGDFFSAEAAMNRAFPEIAATIINDGIPPGPAHPAEIARDSMSAAAQARLSPPNGLTIPLAPPVGTSPADLAGADIVAHLMDTDTFPHAVRDAIHTFVVNSLPAGEVLPARHAPIAGTVAYTPNSPDFFWLIEGIGTPDTPNTQNPLDEFGSPAFVNLSRDDAGIAGNSTLLVGIADITALSPVAFGTPVPVPNGIAQTWRVWVEIEPYITVNSYAGAVELVQGLILPFDPFFVDFVVITPDGDPVVFASVEQPPGSGIPNLDAWLTVGYPGGVYYNGGSPPDNVGMPLMQSDLICTCCNTVHMGGDSFRNSIRIAAYNPSGWVTVSGGTIEGRTLPGNVRQVRVGSGAWQTVEYIQITGNATLIGDFTGINVYAGYNTLTLGTATTPLVVDNTPANTTNIWGSGHPMTVNVTGGLTLENVRVGTNAAMNFRSPDATDPNFSNSGSPGSVSMGATFVAGGHIGGEIRVADWVGGIPQIISHQAIGGNIFSNTPLRMTSVTPIQMGALFKTTNGGNIHVHIDNGGAAFDGMILGNQSAGGGITGNTNMNVPPALPSMQLMPFLQHWLSTLAADPYTNPPFVDGWTNGGTGSLDTSGIRRLN